MEEGCAGGASTVLGGVTRVSPVPLGRGAGRQWTHRSIGGEAAKKMHGGRAGFPWVHVYLLLFCCKKKKKDRKRGEMDTARDTRQRAGLFLSF